MLRAKRSLLGLLAVELLAVAIGMAVPFAGIPYPKGAPAYAATHCTRYAPTTDTNCGTKGSMDGNYITPSFAWRDSNSISMNTDRSWELYLQFNGGGTTQYKTGYGTIGSTPGTGLAQTKADCNDATGPVTGECHTNWHD